MPKPCLRKLKICHSVQPRCLGHDLDRLGLAGADGYTGGTAVFPRAVGALHGATGSWTPSLILLLALLVPQFVFGLAAGRNRQLVAA